jgi:conjugative relaxase-like TrwC/TraI family protein
MFILKKFYSHGKNHANYLTENCNSQDYYDEKERIKGQWHGELSEVFKLKNKEITVDSQEFKKLVEGINPVTDGKLTQNKTLVKGYDYQCSCDKSISIMAIIGGDKRLITAHEEALREALSELEKHVGVRDRAGEKVNTKDYHTTGNMVAGIFTHESSRDLDPQLHSHVFIPSVTYDKKTGRFLAIENADIQKNIGYLGRIYQNSLHKKVKELGYETRLEYNKKGQVKGFQIKEVPEEIIKLYSKRSIAIEYEAERFKKLTGRPPTLEERNIIAKDSRKAKLYEISAKELSARQKSQLSDKELSALDLIRERAENHQHITLGLSGFNKRRIEHEQFLNQQIEHITERKSIFSVQELKREILRAGSGAIDMELLNDVIRSSNKLILLDKDTYTSQEIIKEEKEIIEAIEKGIGKDSPVNEKYKAFSNLKDLQEESEGRKDFKEQREAVQKILSSKDKYMVFRGVAGAGKSSTLKEIERGLKQVNVKGLYFSPTSTATENLLKEGFENARNLATLFVMEEKGLLNRPDHNIRNSVIFIDEAGQISSKDGNKLIRIAERYDCKIIFTGDSKQHSSVGRGDFLRLIEENSYTTKAEVTKIFRQKENPELLKVAEMLSQGKAKEAMDRLDELGLVHESNSYIKITARNYVKDIEGGKNLQKAICSAPTRAEVAQLAIEIRKELKATGYLEGKDTEVKNYKSYDYTEVQKKNIRTYREGDLLVFNLNSARKHRQNETFRVVEVKENYCVLSDGSKFFPQKSGHLADLGKESRINLAANDIIRIGANDKVLGIRNGHFLKIAKIEQAESGFEITAKRLDNKFEEIGRIKFNTDRFKRYEQGYVLTSYKRQGQTYDIHHVASKTMDSKAAYVLGTRERYELHIYTSNRQKLKDSTERTGNRELATDRIKNLEEQEQTNIKSLQKTSKLNSKNKKLDYNEIDNGIRQLKKEFRTVISAVIQSKQLGDLENKINEMKRWQIQEAQKQISKRLEVSRQKSRGITI